MCSRGLLVAFEGIDGSGKSTQASLLNLSLEKRWSVVTVKAKWPRDDRAISNLVNQIGISTNSLAFMFLYQALHRRQFEEARDALNNNSIVIADRWNASFWVYHENFGPLSSEPQRVLEVLDRIAFESLEPDITFFLDIPIRVSFQRLMEEGDDGLFGEREVEFYETVVSKYKEMASKYGWIVLDGTAPVETIHQYVRKEVLNRVGRK